MDLTDSGSDAYALWVKGGADLGRNGVYGAHDAYAYLA